MNRCFTALILLATTASTFAQERDAVPVDVAKFDIDGVWLNSSGDQVLQALRARFPKEKLMIRRSQSRISGARMIKSVDLDTSDFDLTVGFVEALPPTKVPEQVWDVIIAYKGDKDGALNYTKSFRDEIVGKYGAPTKAGNQTLEGRMRDYWCAKLLPKGYSQVTTYPCDDARPYATFYMNSFSIQDTSLGEAVENWIEAHAPKPIPKKLPRL